jgi:nucleoside-diphosphate-sugar epimerase
VAHTALIIGATGLSGSYLGRLLKAEGWTVVTVARATEAPGFSDRHIAVDLLDAAATAAALSAALDATHLFYCTWTRRATEAENVAANGAMIRNVMAAVAGAPLRHAALVTGLKHYLGPFDNYARTRPYTPFLESQARLPGENFYYTQEDVLFEAAERGGFSWSVHRPHTMIGLAIGNAMNMAQTLAAYATICRHTGRPFVFPGSTEQYNAVTDVTDARILARQLLWAATTPAAANTPFNIANGEVFRWTWLWSRIADYFGVEVAGHPGHPTPLEAQMAGAPSIWTDIVARHGLQPMDVDRLANWWHSDADLGRTLECFSDMTNSRRLGFRDWQSTEGSFFDVFDTLKATRIIPG